MEKKILVALDDSENALRAITYLAENFNVNNEITILSIVQDTAALCGMNSPELTPYFKSQQSNFCVLEDKKKGIDQRGTSKGQRHPAGCRIQRRPYQHQNQYQKKRRCQRHY